MKRWMAISFLVGALASALVRLCEANARAERAEEWAETVADEAGLLANEISFGACRDKQDQNRREK